MKYFTYSLPKCTRNNKAFQHLHRWNVCAFKSLASPSQTRAITPQLPRSHKFDSQNIAVITKPAQDGDARPRTTARPSHHSCRFFISPTAAYSFKTTNPVSHTPSAKEISPATLCVLGGNSQQTDVCEEGWIHCPRGRRSGRRQWNRDTLVASRDSHRCKNSRVPFN